MPAKYTPEQRIAAFWAKVDKSGECWEWTSCRNKQGYGQFGQERAHRVAYSLTYGSIPTGLYVLHACDNPPCVNPVHLFLGTQLDNVADRDNKGRQAKGDRHGYRLNPSLVVRGSRNGSAKLTEEAVAEMRALLQSGWLLRELSHKYGISIMNASWIVNRRGWRHVL